MKDSHKLIVAISVVILIFLLYKFTLKHTSPTSDGFCGKTVDPGRTDRDIKPSDTLEDVFPRGGRLYPIVIRGQYMNDWLADGGECTVKKMNPWSRGKYIYGCPSGDCCKRNCCQVMPPMCTAGGGDFCSRYGNEGPPVAGPIPMKKRFNKYAGYVGGECPELTSCDLCPSPEMCPACHPKIDA